MGESHENLLKAIKHYQESLDKYTENRNEAKLLHYLDRLYKLPIRVIHLEQTGVGRTVNSLRKLGGEVGDSAKSLVTKWKEMVVGEQEESEEEDEDEDGYQTGEEGSSSDEQEETSSQKKGDNHRTDTKKDKESEDRKRDKERHHKHNGHSSSSSKHKSHKRRNEDSSSEEETTKKKKKEESSGDEDRHKHRRKIESSSDEDAKKDKKQKEEEKKKHKLSDEKKHKESSSKDKHKSSKKEEHKRSKDKDRKSESSKSKDRESHRSKEKSDKHKSSKKSLSAVPSSNKGIDSGSGPSFAEALGMCGPPSSSKIKKKSEKKEKSKTEDAVVPKLLKDPIPEPLDLKLESLLPTITPNYRPLGNLIGSESLPKKSVSDYEALSNIITSKNQRTKVYSGNKMGCGKVASLFELCIRILQDNIDALEYTGGVPYTVLKPVLEKSTPNQLYTLEHHNPYLIEDTDDLWQLHCQKEFRNKKREEFESWREMYLRCLDERDAKLKALTANIKQSQDKSLPVRTTKLAYVDAVAKPPRNIARKQAKNGTGFVTKPAVTPAARLATLATAGEAGKVAVPNPGSRAVERTGHQVKPKKAPLMLKSISSFKNRFKR